MEHSSYIIKRDVDGLLIVLLTFKTDPSLGETKYQTIERFISLEKNYAGIPWTGTHDTELNTDLSKLSVWYIPHHAAFKGNIHTTKLRIVFDGSLQRSIQRFIRRYMQILYTYIGMFQRQIFSKCTGRFRSTKSSLHFKAFCATVTFVTTLASYLSLRAIQ